MSEKEEHFTDSSVRKRVRVGWVKVGGWVVGGVVGGEVYEVDR